MQITPTYFKTQTGKTIPDELEKNIFILPCLLFLALLLIRVSVQIIRATISQNILALRKYSLYCSKSVSRHSSTSIMKFISINLIDVFNTIDFQFIYDIFHNLFLRRCNSHCFLLLRTYVIDFTYRSRLTEYALCIWVLE